MNASTCRSIHVERPSAPPSASELLPLVPGLAALFEITEGEARRRFVDGVDANRPGQGSRPIGEGSG